MTWLTNEMVTLTTLCLPTQIIGTSLEVIGRKIFYEWAGLYSSKQLASQGFRMDAIKHIDYFFYA